MRLVDRPRVVATADFAAERIAAAVAGVAFADADAAAAAALAAVDLEGLARGIGTAAPEDTALAVEAMMLSAGALLRMIGREAAADEAVSALLAIAAARAEAPVGASVPARGLVDGVAGLALGAAAVATLRRRYAARQDAQAARSELAVAASGVIEDAGGTLGGDASEALAGVVGAAVETLTRIAADRAPLVRVETGISLPSVVLAYRLYGDPERSTELVERNKVATPAMMPVAFEAVAP